MALAAAEWVGVTAIRLAPRYFAATRCVTRARVTHLVAAEYLGASRMAVTPTHSAAAKAIRLAPRYSRARDTSSGGRISRGEPNGFGCGRVGWSHAEASS